MMLRSKTSLSTVAEAEAPDARGAASGASIHLRGLSRRFGEVVALDHVDLDIADGEFMTLLGASGSGKSTMLSLIAGFDDPTDGTVEVAGRRLNGIPPHKRNIGMVFQNYALFPHMTVGENVAFPLRQRGVGKDEVRRRVAEALKVVELTGLERRRPAALSGGQQQRVALARAIVFQPQILLMDEPLAALDKRLREQLQVELKNIHAELGITFVFVTHDQEEALAMSDRIALLRNGRIEQVGSVDEIYERPVTPYAADFIGESNLFEGVFSQRGDAAELAAPEGVLRTPGAAALSGASAATLLVRPEKLSVLIEAGAPSAGDVNTVQATVTGVTYLGAATRVDARTPHGRDLVARVGAEMASQLRPGQVIRVCWRPADGWIIPQPTPAAADGHPTGVDHDR